MSNRPPPPGPPAPSPRNDPRAQNGDPRRASTSPPRRRLSSPEPKVATPDAATKEFMVQIPPNVRPGTLLRVQLPNGTRLDVRVPEGVPPGGMVKVLDPGLPPDYVPPVRL